MLSSQGKQYDEALLRSLLPYCRTDTQKRYINLVIEHGGMRPAARAIGLSNSTLSDRVALVRNYAATKGWSPEHDMTKAVPEGFHVKGVSTYYDKEGEVRGQWVKSQADREQLEAELKVAVQSFVESVPKAAPAPGPKKDVRDELVNVHILTDYHLGMKAWHEETGEDWDIKIAEDLLIRWFADSIQSSPDAKVGILAQLGDLLHWDGYEPVTPTSRHVLDADTRFQKVVRVAIRALRRVIYMMLKKYEHVHVIMADANHDPAAGAWLREMFAVFYEDEPRITVDNSADTYYCYEHGLTSLFFHHGHRRKPANIDDVFAAKFRDVFGRTKFSYAHMGHLHHDKGLETNLMIVEQHRTMAAKDAYASSHGFLSGRGAPVITYHKKYGDVGRQNKTPEMLQ